uniref:Large ribosomal subunit protein uL4 C-terminal domain-containing protein n=1 Tax=Oryctolagus cuniculus TaxID=9986 RepID=A0A5F9C6F8_RABIT
MTEWEGAELSGSRPGWIMQVCDKMSYPHQEGVRLSLDEGWQGQNEKPPEDPAQGPLRGHVGRFCIWTESAFRKLDKMLNTDLSRILKSPEIQRALRAPRKKIHRRPEPQAPRGEGGCGTSSQIRPEGGASQEEACGGEEGEEAQGRGHEAKEEARGGEEGHCRQEASCRQEGCRQEGRPGRQEACCLTWQLVYPGPLILNKSL